jgi:2-aminoadipate transaminase
MNGASRLRFASRMDAVAPSAVREILKAAEQPDILSLAGGLPAPELFPAAEIARAYADVLAHEPGGALQYGVTEGFGPLREWIAQRMTSQGIDTDASRVLITHGSQQGIDLMARVFLDAGDCVAVENPTYLAAIQAFNGFQAKVCAVESDDDGMLPDALEEALRTRRPKFLYVIPEFQNPKGTSFSLERRRRLLSLAAAHGVPVLEDNPYGELRFRGTSLPPLAALGSDATVVYLGTFSKTLAPGLRIGWMVAPPEIYRKLVISKQAADLHTATLAQRAAANLLERFDYEGHLKTLRAFYGERCETMLEGLKAPAFKAARWATPEGGLFLWIRLPPGLDDLALFQRALARKVAVVPGRSFFCEPGHHGFVRLNFSNVAPAKIQEALRRLGEAMAEGIREA